MEPRARIGCNIDTCKRVRPPIIKLKGYEQRENIGGGEGAGNSKHTQTHRHTHTHSVHRDTQGGLNLGQ